MIREFYTGTYAALEQPGILRVRADFSSEHFEVLEEVKQIENPSWITWHPGKKMLYSVIEKTPNGGLAAFRVKNGRAVPAGTWPTGGSDPCHISLSDDAEFLFVANYTSGALSVFQLDEEGLPIRRTEVKQHHGKGTHPMRQEGPHVHFSQYVNDRLFAVDLGLDRIFRYTLDKTSGTLEEKDHPILIPEGNGPRHFVFHPKKAEFLYIVAELTGKLLVYREENGEYVQMQEIRTLPDDFQGENTSAAIRISADGRYLFVSNRGFDGIAVFGIREDGTVQLLQQAAAGGKAPRDIQLFGKLAGEEETESYVVAANQDSRELTVLKWETDSEKLIKMHMNLKTEGKPVCISSD